MGSFTTGHPYKRGKSGGTNSAGKKVDKWNTPIHKEHPVKYEKQTGSEKPWQKRGHTEKDALDHGEEGTRRWKSYMKDNPIKKK